VQIPAPLLRISSTSFAESDRLNIVSEIQRAI